MIGLSLSARLLLDGCHCHAVSAAGWLPRQWRYAWVDRLPAWLDRWRTRSRAHSADSRVRGWMRFPRGSVLFPCDLLHASVAARVTGCAWPGSSSRLPVLGDECDYCTSIVISNSRACVHICDREQPWWQRPRECRDEGQQHAFNAHSIRRDNETVVTYSNLPPRKVSEASVSQRSASRTLTASNYLVSPF